MFESALNVWATWIQLIATWKLTFHAAISHNWCIVWTEEPILRPTHPPAKTSSASYPPPPLPNCRSRCKIACCMLATLRLLDFAMCSKRPVFCQSTRATATHSAMSLSMSMGGAGPRGYQQVFIHNLHPCLRRRWLLQVCLGKTFPQKQAFVDISVSLWLRKQQPRFAQGQSKCYYQIYRYCRGEWEMRSSCRGDSLLPFGTWWDMKGDPR